MITLERLRLVHWHNFEDTVIEIGNRCLLAGDNGSGKSTVDDAIQYVLAANLRMARFNSAAEDRRGGGRDLMGYVRCKVGSEYSEYRRDDTISHVMLQWSVTRKEVVPGTRGAGTPGAGNAGTGSAAGGGSAGKGFACGVCVEAFRDNHYTEHFWVGANVSIDSLEVRSGDTFLSLRQFKTLHRQQIEVYDAKRLYLRDLSTRLGVFKRLAEVNPYFDTLTRSIGFRPLDSIDRFVCDYILEENPVPIQDMKQNLENYKEADRQAAGAIEKIAALKNICAKAGEWQHCTSLILRHEFLKIRVEQERVRQQKETAARNLAETHNKLDFITQEIDSLEQHLLDTEQELRAVDMSLAANDAHRLYEEISSRILRLQYSVGEKEKEREKYETLKAQGEALLGRKLRIDEEAGTGDREARANEIFDQDYDEIQGEAGKYRDEKIEAGKKKEETRETLRETRGELADLERGILRFPDAPQALKTALTRAGIDAFFLAEAAEISDPDWVDAVEGWLNTQRFALLVDPQKFQKALEVYDQLPRSIAGASLPNIAKMRDAPVKPGSLAEVLKAEGYARIYLDYILGRVMRADIRSLKTHDSAVTRECMTYHSHTASRIREEVYRRHYLGQSAREEWRKRLLGEVERLEEEAASWERAERTAREGEDYCNRALKCIPELKHLFPSLAACSALRQELARAEEELAGVDTRSFRELEAQRKALELQIAQIKKENNYKQMWKGNLQTKLENYRDELEGWTRSQEEKEEETRKFGEEHPLQIGECESYVKKRLASSTLEELNRNYLKTLERYRSDAERARKEYGSLVRNYETEFHYLLGMEPQENEEAEGLLKRLETSELPVYREKIDRALKDAEREFKDHFISRLNEHIEEARISFDEINEILKTLHFGRDQYQFHLDELSERRGQIEMIRQAARIPASQDGLFSQLSDPAEQKAIKDIFDKILNSPLDSKELRDLCDYRTYFHYDIYITESDLVDGENRNSVRLSLSRVLKEKSGGESQTPYYVAIAASFYRFYKARPESTVRLVIFDEAFNRMDDERIGKILSFYHTLNLQIITSVPPEKIEAIAPYMDRINVISRVGGSVKVRDCYVEEMGGIETGAGGAET